MITLFRFLQNGLYHPRPPPDATCNFKICHIGIILNSVSRQTYKNLSSKYWELKNKYDSNFIL
jgi:hypothetical protein